MLGSQGEENGARINGDGAIVGPTPVQRRQEPAGGRKRGALLQSAVFQVGVEEAAPCVVVSGVLGLELGGVRIAIVVGRVAHVDVESLAGDVDAVVDRREVHHRPQQLEQAAGNRNAGQSSHLSPADHPSP